MNEHFKLALQHISLELKYQGFSPSFNLNQKLAPPNECKGIGMIDLLIISVTFPCE
jgi:hypothetical protein